jgi:hypothetical protein
LGGEGYRNLRPLGLGNWAFDSYVIYFSIIVSALPLGVQVGIGTSSNCKDCGMSWEGFILLLGSWVCGGGCGDGLASFLIWGLLLCTGEVICGTARGYVICGAGEGMLYVKLTGAVDGWLWHNGKIDSMPEVVLDWFGRLVVKEAKDKMMSIAGGKGSIAWCG